MTVREIKSRLKDVGKTLDSLKNARKRAVDERAKASIDLQMRYCMGEEGFLKYLLKEMEEE